MNAPAGLLRVMKPVVPVTLPQHLAAAGRGQPPTGRPRDGHSWCFGFLLFSAGEKARRTQGMFFSGALVLHTPITWMVNVGVIARPRLIRRARMRGPRLMRKPAAPALSFLALVQRMTDPVAALKSRLPPGVRSRHALHPRRNGGNQDAAIRRPPSPRRVSCRRRTCAIGRAAYVLIEFHQPGCHRCALHLVLRSGPPRPATRATSVRAPAARRSTGAPRRRRSTKNVRPVRRPRRALPNPAACSSATTDSSGGNFAMVPFSAFGRGSLKVRTTDSAVRCADLLAATSARPRGTSVTTAVRPECRFCARGEHSRRASRASRRGGGWWCLEAGCRAGGQELTSRPARARRRSSASTSRCQPVDLRDAALADAAGPFDGAPAGSTYRWRALSATGNRAAQRSSRPRSGWTRMPLLGYQIVAADSLLLAAQRVEPSPCMPANVTGELLAGGRRPTARAGVLFSSTTPSTRHSARTRGCSTPALVARRCDRHGRRPRRRPAAEPRRCSASSMEDDRGRSTARARRVLPAPGN